MTQLRRVVTSDGRISFSVVDELGDALGWIEDYLVFATDQFSPNTVQSYARSLADWAEVLALRGEAWDDFHSEAFGDFLNYIRYGDTPGTPRIGPPPKVAAPATVQARSAAVLAFYTWQADVNGVTTPYERLFSAKRRAGRSPYKPMLEGVAPRSDTRATIYKVRSGPRRRTPVLTPNQVNTILDACSQQGTDGEWSNPPAGLRDRLLFATLSETGMRIGQALSLRHHDWILGRGSQPAIRLAARQDHPHGVRSKSSENLIYISDSLERLYSAYAWHLTDMGIDAYVPDFPHHFAFVNLAKPPYFAPMRSESVQQKIRGISKAHPSLPDKWSAHWFRHTHASALLLSGVPPHVVQQRLGHADVQTTLNTYGWVTADAELRALSGWKDFTAGWETHR
ncbi:tyrosine-type recombinase/integrase [Microbacterium sp. RU33B]|uniref:tyrosine-type recombinase/integrase n=1 Tax=Microbacterium sp. RU33B TaxID=1907390 RepID=UPI000963065B|nr:tyrosine-type recombinase/integrase [Microbacterium sp. RU33B]SIT72116.1 Site-specific recombinase XerD [Microbacterium sp. RU33B]